MLSCGVRGSYPPRVTSCGRLPVDETQLRGVPDGTAFTSFLNMLNGGVTGVGNCASSLGSPQTGGFANHCDWRLPTIAELQTIIDTSQGLCGGGSGACIDPTFGPTAASGYWSSTTLTVDPPFAWLVTFNNGLLSEDAKNLSDHVRAVRGGFPIP